jgi:hypothetical protein
MLKPLLNKVLRVCELNLASSEQGPVVCWNEHGSAPQNFIRQVMPRHPSNYPGHSKGLDPDILDVDQHCRSYVSGTTQPD